MDWGQEYNKPMLAALYHLHHQAYDEDFPFWRGLAAKQGCPILELGCGTGRVLLDLAQAGHPVVGLDHDPEMLAFLRNGLEGKDCKDVSLIEADMTDFSLDQQFPLIILPCNTYSTLDVAQRESALKAVYDHLIPGGAFATSLPNPAWLADLPLVGDPEEEMVFEHPESGNPVQVSSAWTREGEVVRMIWHYDHLLLDGNVKRVSTSITHYIESAETFTAEFKAQGFGVEMYGDFKSRAYSEESVYLILVGVKE
jgi:SAM-dependent methyltransferase